MNLQTSYIFFNYFPIRHTFIRHINTAIFIHIHVQIKYTVAVVKINVYLLLPTYELMKVIQPTFLTMKTAKHLSCSK